MTILNIALPQMTAGLSPTSTQQLWIIDIYSLIQAGLLVSFAAIADCFGRKRMLMLGYSIFAVASLGVLITETPEAVITIRALLGIGGAMIMPTTLSLIRVIFTSPRERATALSIWAAVSGLGAAVGPLFGGMLLEHFSWHVTRSVGNQNIRRRRKPSRARSRNSTVHRFCPARLVHYPVPAQQRTAPGHRIVPKPAILRGHHCRARVHFRHRYGIAAARTMDTDCWRSEPRSGWCSLIPCCNCERDCVTFRSPTGQGGSVREPCSVVSPPSCIVLNSQARGYSRQSRQQINASFPKYSTLLAPRQQCHSNSPCPNSSLQRASRSPTLCRSRGSLAAASCCSPQSWSFYSPRKEETSRRPRTN